MIGRYQFPYRFPTPDLFTPIASDYPLCVPTEIAFWAEVPSVYMEIAPAMGNEQGQAPSPG